MSILDLVRRHEARAAASINLVASENLLSPAARSALSSDMSHRYCIPPEGERPAGLWDYPNQTFVREVYATTQALAQRIYGGTYADVRPLSGNNVAFIVLAALVPPGGTVYSVPANCGGHFSTRVICAREGLAHFDLPYDRTEGAIDVDRLRVLAERAPPDLIFLDASMQLFPHPVRAIRAAVGPDVIISYDASHLFGLIGGRRFQDPLAEGADLIHGSTHKSLFGPQKGMIICRENDATARRIFHAITPAFVSNMHCHHVAALGVALEELDAYGSEYANQIVRNARAIGHRLAMHGFDVAFPEKQFTDCHQLFCGIGTRDVTLAANTQLERVGIHANVVQVPFRGNDFGLRLGVAEVTRRGMQEADLELVADAMADALSGSEPSVVAEQVAALSRRFRGVLYTSGHDCQSARTGRS